ncbi:alpha/beta fold hydrolase, partial [Desertihabitans aurantiacus]|uniref:alpha/beta fold hydrolase n=1 Tax=Desertihabitans aurantiacus TaxID=2282477 RepID=UPI0018E59C36
DAPCRVGLAGWPGPQRAVAPLRHSQPRPVAGYPDVPTLRLAGSDDRLLPRAPDGAVRLEGGHWLPEEAPEPLAEALTGWLSGLDLGV